MTDETPTAENVAAYGYVQWVLGLLIGAFIGSSDLTGWDLWRPVALIIAAFGIWAWWAATWRREQS